MAGGISCATPLPFHFPSQRPAGWVCSGQGWAVGESQRKIPVGRELCGWQADLLRPFSPPSTFSYSDQDKSSWGKSKKEQGSAVKKVIFSIFSMFQHYKIEITLWNCENDNALLVKELFLYVKIYICVNTPTWSDWAIQWQNENKW